MENGYWKGQVDQTLEFNDKEHERIHQAVCELRKDVIGMKLEAGNIGLTCPKCIVAGHNDFYFRGGCDPCNRENHILRRSL